MFCWDVSLVLFSLLGWKVEKEKVNDKIFLAKLGINGGSGEEVGKMVLT